MDQEIYKIAEFLIERAKRHIIDGYALNKIYWILRYPDKPKLVYSPIDIHLLFFYGPFLKLLPHAIQAQWHKRKATNPINATLEAVCAIVTCKYNPGPTDKYPDRKGYELLVLSIHTPNAIAIYHMFFANIDGTVVFDGLEKADFGAPQGPAAQIFPSAL